MRRPSRLAGATPDEFKRYGTEGSPVRLAADMGTSSAGDDWTAMVVLTGTPDAMVNEAQRLQRLERVPEAIQAYERVLSRWPELANCWFNLGVLQRKARQLSAALA